MLTLRTNHIPTLFEDFENFNNLFNMRVDSRPASKGELRPSVDIFDSGESFIVTVELPGVEEKDIDIEFADNILTVKAERKFTEEKSQGYHRKEIQRGAYSRSMKFSTPVDPTKICAAFKNGLLEISLPKEEKLKPKKIKIATA